MSCSSKRKRHVGSCMRTLVSSTNSFVLEEGKRATLDEALRWIMNLPVRGLLQCLYEFEHLLHVSGYFDAPPLSSHDAVRIDHERAAFDAPDFFAVHVFHLDDVEELACRFLRVRQEVEREAHLGAEALVRF